jgi:hypothetical protein
VVIAASLAAKAVKAASAAGISSGYYCSFAAAAEAALGLATNAGPAAAKHTKHERPYIVLQSFRNASTGILFLR